MSTPASSFDQVVAACEREGLTEVNAQRLAMELAQFLGVQEDEVGILRMQEHGLSFVYPTRLGKLGTIPLNAPTSVAARTASSKRAEIFNNFVQVKHASVFESVDLGNKGPGEKQERVIQKLMSVPIAGPEGVCGVVQVSRKGTTAAAAGPDFTSADLQKLTTLATELVRCFKLPPPPSAE